MEDTITEREFELYEQVRASGVTNMFDVRYVISLSGLSREKIFVIMQNYNKLTEKYPDVRK